MFRFTPLIKSIVGLDIHEHARLDEIRMIIASQPSEFTRKQFYDIVNDCIMNEYMFFIESIEQRETFEYDNEDHEKQKKQAYEAIKGLLLDPDFISEVATSLYIDYVNMGGCEHKLKELLTIQLSDNQALTRWVKEFSLYFILSECVQVYKLRKEMMKKGMSFDVPESVRSAAKRGLELRRENKRGGLSNKQASKLGIGSGVQRATDLSEGKVTLATMKRMKSFFARHRVYKEQGYHDDKTSASYISWMLWGGDAGDRWVTKELEKLEKQENKNEN
jgi:hypothetical protein